MDLRTWREKHRLTQEEAAHRCGVPARSWWRWEHKYVEPSLAVVSAIIKATNGEVTLEDLVVKPAPKLAGQNGTGA